MTHRLTQSIQRTTWIALCICSTFWHLIPAKHEVESGHVHLYYKNTICTLPPVSTNRDARVLPLKGTPRLMESWRVESSQFGFHNTSTHLRHMFQNHILDTCLSDCIKMPPLGNPCLANRPHNSSCVFFCISPPQERPNTFDNARYPASSKPVATLAHQETASLNDDDKINAEKICKCGNKANTLQYMERPYFTHLVVWWCMM